MSPRTSRRAAVGVVVAAPPPSPAAVSTSTATRTTPRQTRPRPAAPDRRRPRTTRMPRPLTRPWPPLRSCSACWLPAAPARPRRAARRHARRTPRRTHGRPALSVALPARQHARRRPRPAWPGCAGESWPPSASSPSWASRLERCTRQAAGQHVGRGGRPSGRDRAGAGTAMTAVDALQTALAAEHAAVYVYGALGARTSESASPLLFAEVADAYATHRAWRDLLVRRLADAGAQPTPAAAIYELPPPTPTAAAVARAALDLELACAAPTPTSWPRRSTRIGAGRSRRSPGRRSARRAWAAPRRCSRERTTSAESAEPTATRTKKTAIRDLPSPRNSRDIPRQRECADRSPVP